MRWLTEEMVDHSVNNLFLDIDTGEFVLVLLVNLADSLTEETVGLGEDVGFVGDGEER